jgi:hypothetical protein
MHHIKIHSVQMPSLQSQYMLCPPLACNTVPIRLYIDSINRRIRSCGIHLILAQNSAVVLQSLRRWLTTARALIQIIPHMSYWVEIRCLDGQGSTVTFWLSGKSTVERAMCGRALCWKPSIQRFIAGSMCGFKTLYMYPAALRLLGMCTSWGFLA